MAKPRKKASKQRTTKKPVEKQALLSKAAKQDILAILIMGVAILIVVAFFNGAGSFGIGLLAVLKQLIGQAVYPLPIALLLLAYALFRVSKYELKLTTILDWLDFSSYWPALYSSPSPGMVPSCRSCQTKVASLAMPSG